MTFNYLSNLTSLFSFSELLIQLFLAIYNLNISYYTIKVEEFILIFKKLNTRKGTEKFFKLNTHKNLFSIKCYEQFYCLLYKFVGIRVES